MRKTRTRYINWACYTTVGLLGVCLSIYQSAVADLMAAFGLNTGGMGLVISLYFAGSLIMPMAFGELSDRIGTRPILGLGFCVLVAGLLLMASGRQVAILVAGSLLVGGGCAIVEGMLTALLAVMNPGRSEAVICLSQSCFCLGAVGGPLAYGIAKFSGIGWRDCFGVMLMCFVISLAVIWFVATDMPRPADAKGLQITVFFKDKSFFLLLALMFLYVGVEEGIAFWVPVYVKREFPAIVSDTFFLSAYWLGMGVGRVLASLIRRRPFTWVGMGIAISFLFIVGMLVFRNEWWVAGCCLVVGFSLAPAWPMLMSAAARQHPTGVNSAIGAMMTASASGGIVIPLVIGSGGSILNMRLAFTILPLLLILLLFILRIYGNRVRIFNSI